MCKKFLLMIVLLVFAVSLTTPLTADQRETNINKMRLKKPKLLVDLFVEAISVEQCLCEDDLGRNFNAIAPKKVKVVLYNTHTATVRAQLKVTYKNLSGQERTILKNLNLRPGKTWVNVINTYTLIKKSSKIMAKLKMSDSRFIEKKISNNTKFIGRCIPYVD